MAGFSCRTFSLFPRLLFVCLIFSTARRQPLVEAGLKSSSLNSEIRNIQSVVVSVLRATEFLMKAVGILTNRLINSYMKTAAFFAYLL